MGVICISGMLPSRAGTDALVVVPRVAVEAAGGRLWADGSGLDAGAAARELVDRLTREGFVASGGVSAVPVAAWAAARNAQPGTVAHVPAGEERAYLAPQPLVVVEPDDRIRVLLEGAGVECCGHLAKLEREAVEVRFGAEVLEPWRRARAEDRRRLFRPQPKEPPHASIDFVDYVVTDPERLIFTTNALLGPLCAALAERGTHARRMTLGLPLANGETRTLSLRPARPSAHRATWLRLARGVLERLTVPDAVIGVSLRVESTESAASVQGDLFDTGFATAAAVEDALTRLLESQGEVVVRATPGAHPLAERRTVFEPQTDVLTADASNATSATPGLTLQLLSSPRPVRVETLERRDHAIPVRYRDREWHSLVTAAGPERISGGQWEIPYAREYFRCVTDAGTLVWLFRERGEWFLQGWWD
jgi:hypothetical protein